MKAMPFSHFEISQNHNDPRWLSSIYQNSLLILINMLKTKITLGKTSFIFYIIEYNSTIIFKTNQAFQMYIRGHT